MKDPGFAIWASPAPARRQAIAAEPGFRPLNLGERVLGFLASYRRPRSHRSTRRHQGAAR